jgi:diguanylate cyclase (GGDEF)-like protein
MAARSRIRVQEKGVREVTPEWRRAHAGSGLTSRLILEFVEREGGGQAVEAVLARAGLADSKAELRDENCWFSYETKLALWRAAEEVLGDPKVAEHAGASALDFSVALGLKRALRALGSPEFVYRNIVRANSKFNWAHRLELVETGRTHVSLRYTDVSGVGYHRYDCDYTKGLLATIPQLFGLPPARVTHSVCGARGGPACEFEVDWTAGLQGLKRAAIALGLSASVLAGGGALAAPVLVPVAGGLVIVGGVAIAARAFAFMRRRLKVLEVRVREQDDAAEGLLSSLGDLSSDLRLDEVLDQITAKAQTAVGGKECALLVADGDRMRADRHSGIPSRSLAALESWATENRGVLREGTVVIDELASAPGLADLALDPDLPLGSMCAAPLVFRDRLYGVLTALAYGSNVFLPGDNAALSAYAAHAAIALFNARLVERLERQAAEDPLTGLANQRAFQRACEAEFSRAQREGGPVSIIALDLDHFKEINDLHGHPYGDDVLRGVADALRASVRPHDTVARLGGEEFAILLPGADADAAYEVAERVRTAIRQVPVEGRRLSSSGGVASDSSPGMRPAQLLQRADRALYDAKRRGRGQTVTSPAPAGRSGLAAEVP